MGDQAHQLSHDYKNSRLAAGTPEGDSKLIVAQGRSQEF